MRKLVVQLRSPRVHGPGNAAFLAAIFSVSVAIAAIATFLAVTDAGNVSTAGSPLLMWLLVGNIFLIMGLFTALARPILHLFRENRNTGGGARLRLRIIGLFSLAAMVPTVVVAIFVGTMINRSVESWFSSKVYTVVDNAARAAQASLDAVVKDVQFNIQETAANLSAPDAIEGYKTAPDQYLDLLRTLSVVRSLPAIYLMNEKRDIVLQVDGESSPGLSTHSDMNWIAAESGQTAIDVSEDLVVSGIVKLEGYENIFLYAARQGPQSLAAQLQATQAGLNAYREADERKNALRTVFVLSYAEVAALVLLGTAWLGISASSSIATPIGRLAGAARSVRDGDLSVRLERPRARDEIDELAEAFNQMTMRLSKQTQDLDRERIEAQTRSSFIEAVLAGVEAGVMRIDSDFNVTIANTSATRILSLDSPQLSGRHLNDFAPEFLPTIRRALETGKTEGANLRRSTDDGLRDIHIRAAPEPDQQGGCIITFHDTSRLVAGQRQAAWRDVARRIAHEIRNPLTPIQLSTERIRRRFGNQITSDRETFDRCTSTILRQVADIGRMVEEFSSFARMPKPTLAPFDVNELVRSVAFTRKMAAPSVSVTFKVPNEPLMVTGDERLIGQALTNVVKNACEAVERHIEAGEAKTGSVTITMERSDTQAIIIVRDTGPGFPVDERDRLLEPYVTTRESGVGLGLAIVNRIVEDHGGSLTLGDNDEGEFGARVELALPVNPVPAETGLSAANEGA